MACTKVLDKPYTTQEKSFEDEVQEWIKTGIVNEETNMDSYDEEEESQG